MYQILVAEDEMIERMALVRRLKKHFGSSIEIREAGNGREAVEQFREKKAQIVILDIAMPGMNGVEAAEEIRRMDRYCSVIFLTAYDDFAYTRRAIIVRALDYLLKPCDENELVAVMEEGMRLADLYAGGPEDSNSHRGAESGDIGQSQFAKAGSTGRGRTENAGAASQEQIAASEPAGQLQPPGDQTSEGGNGIRINQAAESMRRFIHENYMHDISMQDAARAMNYSDVYFCRLFKQCFDQNFTSYLTEYRIEKAKKLLMDGTVNVKDAGMSVGYADPNYFAKVFKRMTGMIPSEFRNSQTAQKAHR